MSLERHELASEELSGTDSELEGFIVSDEDTGDNGTPRAAGVADDEEPLRDRLIDMTMALRPHEDQTQKVIKAHISVLVSALGGPDHTSPMVPPPYKLGHDALACLKDLKRWIKAVDERTGSFDVALACASSGLVTNDLIAIICQWEQTQRLQQLLHRQRRMEKVVLACLELLVLLTWPLELTPELTPRQQAAFPNLKKVQLTYKKEILAYQDGTTLKAVIRMVLPLMAKPRLEREPRENAIIRMALFFVRNVAFIEPAPTSVTSRATKGVVRGDNLPTNVTPDEISLSTVLVYFQRNKVLSFLLTVAGSLGAEFDRQMFGHCCLECIYLLVRGIKPEMATEMPETGATTTANGLELLLATERKRKQLQTLSVSTRHGRFGSLLSLRGNEDKPAIVVSGQEALMSTDMSLAKLDSTKKWHSRSTFRYDADEYLFSEAEAYITPEGLGILRGFVDRFLISGCFNNLIDCVSWLLTSNGDLSYTDPYEKANYFLVIAWFFHFKRKMSFAQVTHEHGLDFGSVGSGLNETNFVLLLSYFRSSFEARDWSSLHVAMICFEEMLLISSNVFKLKPLEDEAYRRDRELAEGIIHKLFETKSFLDLIVEIPKTAAKHSPGYLRVCVSIVHTVLGTFESFANEDIALYVKTKRRQRTKGGLDHNTETQMRDLIDGSDDEDVEQHAKVILKDRRLDFKDTELRFFHTAIVSTYIEFLSRYQDLTPQEIKWALSYFHRLFVVRKDFTNLYRLDFMNLLHKLRTNLAAGSKIREQVDEFIYYFMKRFKQAFQRFPMPVELLFPRLEVPEYKTYLASGELYVKPERKTRLVHARVGKELEFIRQFSLDEKLKIVVTILVEHDKLAFLSWFSQELTRIIQKRGLGEEAALYLHADDEMKQLLIGNSYVRVLIELVGFEPPYIMEEPCVLPSSVETSSLVECKDAIDKWVAMQPVSLDVEASYFLRVKESGDEINYREGEYDAYDDLIAFETSAKADSSNLRELDMLEQLESGLDRGVARRKRAPKRHNDKKPKRTRPRSRLPNLDLDSDDNSKVTKSTEFVHDSDDESDVEQESKFFEREERLRAMLQESGGIVNPQQLEEFVRSWRNMEQHGAPSTTVSKAIELSRDEDVGEDPKGLRKKRRVLIDDDE